MRRTHTVVTATLLAILALCTAAVGQFQLTPSHQAGTFPTSVVTTDFNNDGRMDLAVSTGAATQSVSVLLSNGNGSFQTAKNYGSHAAIQVCVGDFNGDGKKDLAVLTGASASGFSWATSSLALEGSVNPSIYTTGYTSSANFPVTSGTFQTTFAGVYDAFVTKFAP